jgi:hypothetical protein
MSADQTGQSLVVLAPETLELRFIEALVNDKVDRTHDVAFVAGYASLAVSRLSWPPE